MVGQKEETVDMAKTNLVIIMADQLRRDMLGKGFTPAIDSILADGSEFHNMYTASPLCVPARGAFFTGCCPNKNGSLINPWVKRDAHYGDVRKGVENLYTFLEKDWDVIHSGKQHVFTEGGKMEDRPDSRTKFLATEKTYKAFLEEAGVPAPGGKSYKTRVPEMVSGENTKTSLYSIPKTGIYKEDEKYFYDRYYADKALEGLKGRDKDKPLFLSAMFVAPHPPFCIPEPWFSKFTLDDIKLPENVARYYERQSPLQMYNLPGVVGSRYTREEWKESWRDYQGLVAMLDKCVEDIINELKAQGIYDDSIVIFTADHGEMLGSHALFQKMCMYEESTHLPMIIKFPKGSDLNGKHIDATCSNIDVMPTVLDYLGYENIPEMEGISLLPLLKGEKAEERTVFMQYDGNGARSNFQRAAVRGNYKLIADQFKNEEYIELYDVKNDPEETENLAFSPEYDEIATSLYRELDEHMKKTSDLIHLFGIDLEDQRRRYEGLENRQ